MENQYGTVKYRVERRGRFGAVLVFLQIVLLYKLEVDSRRFRFCPFRRGLDLEEEKLNIRASERERISVEINLGAPDTFQIDFENCTRRSYFARIEFSLGNS